MDQLRMRPLTALCWKVVKINVQTHQVSDVKGAPQRWGPRKEIGALAQNIYTEKSTWVAQLGEHLPLAQVMISDSWDQALHWVLCLAGSLRLPLPLPLTLLVLSHSLSLK